MKKILLIGDSISLYYSPFLAEYIRDFAELHNKEGRREAFTDLDRPTGGNGGNSSMVLEYLKQRFDTEAPDYDVFIFNCGLHDVKRLDNAECVISADNYRKNLSEIIEFMSQRNIKTVFITTTHVDDERHNARKQLGFTRYDSDVQKYNEIALCVMKENKIPVFDLGSFTKNLSGDIFIDHVHFKEDVRKLQAAFLAGLLQDFLKQ